MSTDDFFVDASGRYMHDPARINAAHTWNQQRVLDAIQSGAYSTIIVDNTNLRIWDMVVYYRMAVQAGWGVNVVRACTHLRHMKISHILFR